jgi:hypothetical protein
MSQLREWAGALQTTLSDDSIFSSQAAVKGLAHLNTIWPALAQQSNNNEPLFQSLCLAVYDLLNNDDEEIRIEAAETASKIFSADSSASGPTASATLVPLVATQRLSELAARGWHTSSTLFDAAISRAFGSTVQSVEYQLLCLQRAEYALFAEEKQNLYIDDVRETRMWAKVAMHLAGTAAQSKAIEALSLWVKDGLVALKAKFEKDADGPLGWTTDENAFLLGLRVVHAAELLLLLLSRNETALPAVEQEELRSSLLALKDCGGNVLWAREVERVLEGGATGYTWESV